MAQSPLPQDQGRVQPRHPACSSRGRRCRVSLAQRRPEGQRVAHLWVRGEGFQHSPDCPRKTQSTCEAFQLHS